VAFLWLVAAGLQAAAEHGELAGRMLAGGRPIADAVIWLDAPGAPRASEGRFVVRQRNMEFVPRVLAVPVGSTVELPNDDRIFHNVFSFANGKPFDLGLYPTGASKRITLDRPAINRLYCNIRPHMAAYIIAVDSPYYATSRIYRNVLYLRIEDIPGADATPITRGGRAPRCSATVTVGEGQPLEVAWP
jgi:plastocyanin